MNRPFRYLLLFFWKIFSSQIIFVVKGTHFELKKTLFKECVQWLLNVFFQWLLNVFFLSTIHMCIRPKYSTVVLVAEVKKIYFKIY